ncbi:hypothetical protein l11_19770 [Neisseria weaveri LMG 5135]|nr:hypothetical protein l11_19770 [Neisseria weaveri LMG 5135]
MGFTVDFFGRGYIHGVKFDRTFGLRLVSSVQVAGKCGKT